MASLATEGRLGYLTPIQKEALEKAKLFPGADPQLFDDHYLLRFLRARNFDLEKTETMWTNFIKWRKDAQVDEVPL